MNIGMSLRQEQTLQLDTPGTPHLRQELLCLTKRLRIWANEEFVEGNTGSSVVVGRGLKATMERLDIVG